MSRILVVEDNPVAAELISLVLQQIHGLTVDTVPCARSARQHLAGAAHYCAVITDVHLPGEDGLSLASDIPRLPGCAALPVIVVTSDGNDELRRRAEMAGVHAFLRKPWSAERLRETINSIVNGSPV